jgi:hypothetical protein
MLDGLNDWMDERSNTSILLIIVGIVFIVVFAGFGIALAFYHPPPVLHATSYVTSDREYNAVCGYYRTGAYWTCWSQDITVKGFSHTWTLSCTYYKVGDNMTLVKNPGYDWQLDGLHEGCSVIQ